MKIPTLLITTFALTLSFSIAQENGAVPAATESRADPYKTENHMPKLRKPDQSTKTLPVEMSPREVGPLGKTLDNKWIAVEDPLQGASSLPDEPPVQAPQPPTQAPQVEAKSTSQGHEALSFSYEDFSFPVEMGADIKREKLSDPSGLLEYLSKRLETDLEKDLVRQETHIELVAKSGFPAYSENYVSTDSDFGGPNRLGYRIALQYDATNDISLRFDLDSAVEAGSVKILHEGKQVEKPLIHRQKINTTVTLSLGKACLVSAEVRTVGSKQGTNTAKRVFVSFITASAVR